MSSKSIFVQDGSGNALFTLGQSSIAYIILNDDQDPAGSWVAWQVYVSSIASGILNYRITSDVDFTTSSLTDVAITGFTVTPEAGVYSCWFSADAKITSNNRLLYSSVYSGGVVNENTTRTLQGVSSNYSGQISSIGIFDLNGSQAVDVRVRSSSGNITIGKRSLILIRLGSS